MLPEGRNPASHSLATGLPARHYISHLLRVRKRRVTTEERMEKQNGLTIAKLTKLLKLEWAET